MDVERTIEFILDVEAKHAAAIQRHDEMLRQLIEVNLSLTGHLEDLAAHVDRLDARVDKLAARMEEIANAQAQTDQRLNALIDIVDKMIRHNGRSSA
jgi:methyl-accepting chemotaxis protein